MANGEKSNEWQSLLSKLKKGNVIPVIGGKLYQVKVGDKELYLYDYLADRLLEEFQLKASYKPNTNNKFAYACLQVILHQIKMDVADEDIYSKVSEKLYSILKTVTISSRDTLRKLARIRSFKAFIITTFDEILSDEIRKVRAWDLEPFSYTANEGDLLPSQEDIQRCFKKNKTELTLTILFYLFGHLEAEKPGFTEKDIIETLVRLQEDRSNKAADTFLSILKSKKFLFLGCCYDDWLFRFFVRSITDSEYELTKNVAGQFFGENLGDIRKDPDKELREFLKTVRSKIFYFENGNAFIEKLFEELEGNEDKELSEQVIKEEEFPVFAFISFDHRDKDAVRRLKLNLEGDHIPVWLDEEKLKGGEFVEKKIYNTIKKCKVFMPLLSENALKNDGTFHFREWRWALARILEGDEELTIIPVWIDNQGKPAEKFSELEHLREFDDFKKPYHLSVPGGKNANEYGKLLEDLSDLWSEKP